VRPDFRWPAATHSNRRRLRVFLGTLTVALGVSLAVTWLRPPEYRAVARLEITPGIASVSSSRPTPSGATASQRPFLTEVQALASRPVFEATAMRLKDSGEDLSVLGPDPVAALQAQIETLPVADTNVVELIATGRRRDLLAPLVNAVIDVYQDRLADAYRSSSSESMAQADEEVTKLEATVIAKRREGEAFRLRNNIVSVERDQNEVLARVRNLSASLSTAEDRVAAAEGKLGALGTSAAAGKAVVRSRDDPTLANLEQRASQMREELRELERGFTSDYLAKDPKVVTLRVRLAELERQIVQQRAASQQTSLLEAQEELAGAQAAAARIRNQMGAERREVTQFTARFNEYKSIQDELAELEKTYRDAVQQRARLDASERARMPSTRVLEAATPPRDPWRPLYWRDTVFSLGGSLGLALLAIWLVELFNRPEPQPAVVLIQPQAGALRYEGSAQALANRSAPAMSLPGSEPVLLPRQAAFPRELRADEVAALIRASDDESRVVMLLLLSGLNLDEALELRWSDVDLASGTIHAGGESGREIAIDGRLGQLLQAAPKSPGSELLVSSMRRPATQDSIDAQILCAAHDATIEDATQVTSACLRHTYVAFLVRQGIRFADLTRLVGPLPAEIVGAYSALSPPGARVTGAQVQRLHPALRDGRA
jgi:polysaccharide biosynthesis transport protein